MGFVAAYTPETFTPKAFESTNREWTKAQVDERHHALLSKPSELLHLLQYRGLTITSIQKFKLGIFSDNMPGIYTIPVYDIDGELLTVRYYDREKDPETLKRKKWGIKGHTNKRLYPLLGMNGANPLWICEGEFDAMIAIQNGLHVVTTISGAITAPAVLKDHADVFHEWRRFVLAFDNDLPGYAAAAHIGIESFPGRIDGVIGWPTGFDKDISDWYNQGRTTQELESLIIPFDAKWGAQAILAHDQKYHHPKEWEANFKANEDRLKRLLSTPWSPDAPTIFSDDATLFATAREPGEDEPAPEAAPADAGAFPQDVWPESGFLGSFFDYSRHLHPYIPSQFIAGTAFSIMSAAIGRKAFVRSGATDLFTNTYSLLIGTSGIGKTSSINVGSRIIDLFDGQLRLPGTTSNEALISTLSRKPEGLFIFSEGQTFVDLFERTYGQAVYGSLLMLYDGESLAKSFLKDGKQPVEAKKPHVALLAGCVPDLFGTKIQEKDIRSGFIPRFAIWPADSQSGGSDQTENPHNEDMDAEVTGCLRESVGVAKEMFMSLDVTARMKEWANEWAGRVAASGDSKFGSCFNRMRAYCRKFAMMIQLNHCNGAVVQRDSLERSIRICDWMLGKVNTLIGGSVLSSNKNVQNSRRIKEMLMRSKIKAVARSVLIKNTGMDCRELDSAIQVLIEVGDAEQAQLRNGKRGPMTTYYKLIEKQPGPK